MNVAQQAAEARLAAVAGFFEVSEMMSGRLLWKCTLDGCRYIGSTGEREQDKDGRASDRMFKHLAAFHLTHLYEVWTAEDAVGLAAPSPEVTVGLHMASAERWVAQLLVGEEVVYQENAVGSIAALMSLAKRVGEALYEEEGRSR